MASVDAETDDTTEVLEVEPDETNTDEAGVVAALVLDFKADWVVVVGLLALELGLELLTLTGLVVPEVEVVFTGIVLLSVHTAQES